MLQKPKLLGKGKFGIPGKQLPRKTSSNVAGSLGSQSVHLAWQVPGMLHAQEAESIHPTCHPHPTHSLPPFFLVEKKHITTNTIFSQRS